MLENWCNDGKFVVWCFDLMSMSTLVTFKCFFKPRLVEESVENIALPKVDKHLPPLRLVVDEERDWGFPEENPRVPT